MARILYIGGSESYIPSLAANSIQVMRMAGAFAALGHAVTLVVPHGSRHLGARSAPDPFDFYGIEQRFHLHRLRVPRGGSRPGLILFGLGVRRLARGQHWDLVYCRHAVASILLARAGVQHLFEAHHYRLAGRVDRWHLPILRSPLIERLVLLSPTLREPFVAAGVDPQKLLVAPDGVDLPVDPPAETPGLSRMDRRIGTTGAPKMERTAARRRLRELAAATDDAPIALYAGSLGTLKGTELLLETARLCPEIRFVLLGGPEAATIAHYRRLAADLDNLQIAGTVEPPAVAALLGAADLLLLPHTRASATRYVSPLKIFEYLAAGRPIVAANLETTRDVLEQGTTALLVPPDDAGELATAIRRLVGEPELGARLAGAAGDAVRAYSWQARARTILAAQPTPRPPRRRVLHLINSFHPLAGGAERQAAALAQRQVAAGDAVTVLTRRRRGLPPLDGYGPVLVRRVGAWPLRGPGFLAAALGWLAPRRHQFDQLHAHQARLPAAIAAILRGAGGPPALVKLAGLDLPRGRGPLTRLRRAALCRLDVIVATQPAMLEAVRGLGFDPARVVLVPNGVDTARYAPSPVREEQRRALVLTPAALAVLYVGRLERVKGIDLLLAAWPTITAAHPDARLRIAGGGSLATTLKREAPAAVTFLGNVDDALELYQTADLLVMPSRSEGLSNVMLEGMATALAVVATRVSGNAEVIEDGTNGVLVPPGEPAALARAVIDLLGDPDRRRRLGRAARASIVERYRLEAIEEEWAALYARFGRR